MFAPVLIGTLTIEVPQVELLKKPAPDVPLKLTVIGDVALTELSLASNKFTVTGLHDAVVPVEGTFKPILAGVLIATVIFREALPSAGLTGDKSVATNGVDPGEVFR